MCFLKTAVDTPMGCTVYCLLLTVNLDIDGTKDKSTTYQ